MREFEHMKTSLYLTDVLLLRNEGDIVNFLCLEITKTSRGSEVKNNTDIVGVHCGHVYSNFRTAF